MPTRPMPNELKSRKSAHTEGRGDPLDTKHCRVRSNKNQPQPRTTPQTHQTKDHLTTLPFPVPRNMQIVSSTKYIPITPSFVKTLEHGRHRESTNMICSNTYFQAAIALMMSSSHRPVSLFVVEHFVITFNPDGLEKIAPKEMPNFNLLPMLFFDHVPKQYLFPVEVIIIACSNPAKFMYNKRSPSPCSPSFNAVPQ